MAQLKLHLQVCQLQSNGANDIQLISLKTSLVIKLLTSLAKVNRTVGTDTFIKFIRKTTTDKKHVYANFAIFVPSVNVAFFCRR